MNRRDVDLPSRDEIDRAQPADAEEPITDEMLEDEIRCTLIRAMRGQAKPAETSAASCAVRFLAYKAKLPILYGDGFDE